MKTLLLLCTVLLTAASLNAQDEREALLDQLSVETCDCISERELTVENMEMVIGMCVLQASGDKTEEIETVLGYQMYDQADMVSLGEEMGMRLVFSCEPFQNVMMEAAEDGELDGFLGGGVGDNPDRESTIDPAVRDRINRLFPGEDTGDEEWVDIDRPATEEPFGGGDDDIFFEEDMDWEPEVFPPTEEEWVDIDAPTEEEEFGDGSNEIGSDWEEGEWETEVFPPTDEEWVDIDRPATEEDFGNGSNQGGFDEDGMVEREFITGPMPNTNRTAIVYPTVSGQVRRINSGIISEVIIRDADRRNVSLFVTDEVPGVELLQRRANVTITYRETTRYDAASGQNRVMLEVVKVE